MSAATYSPPTRGAFDAECYAAALAYYGHPIDWRYTFSLFDGVLRDCNPATASRAGKAVWTLVNEPTAGFPRRKPASADIVVVRNLTLEGEYPPDPARAHALAIALRDELARMGLIPAATAIEDSGAGFHLAIPLVPIATADHGGGEVVNEAVRVVVQRYIMPVFDRLAGEHGLTGKVTLGSYNIATLMSLPGTWRPPHHKEDDAAYLHDGYARCWLPPHDQEPPVRVESAILSTLITVEARGRLAARASAAATPVAEAAEPLALDDDAVEQWITRYAQEHGGGEDRSGDFHRLVIAAFLKFDAQAPVRHAALIDRLTGGKYGKRAPDEVARSLRKAPPRADRGQSAGTGGGGEVARLRAELAATLRERDQARAEAARLCGELEQLDTDGADRTIQDLNRRATMAEAKYAQVIRVLEDTSLKPRDRLVTVLAMDEANAFRPPLALGDALPAPEPRRVSMAGLEQRAGVGKKTAVLSLLPAHERGHIVRQERPDDVELRGGTRRKRTAIFIGAGPGTRQAGKVNRRRANDSKRKAEKAAAERERIAELERLAAQVRERGCPCCGQDLLATGYHCTGCGAQYTAEELAGLYARYEPGCGIRNPSEAAEAAQGGGRVADSATVDLTTYRVAESATRGRRGATGAAPDGDAAHTSRVLATTAPQVLARPGQAMGAKPDIVEVRL